VLSSRNWDVIKGLVHRGKFIWRCDWFLGNHNCLNRKTVSVSIWKLFLLLPDRIQPFEI
jgi:hypothetical protein